jgi:hypothetical protein
VAEAPPGSAEPVVAAIYAVYLQGDAAMPEGIESWPLCSRLRDKLVRTRTAWEASGEGYPWTNVDPVVVAQDYRLTGLTMKEEGDAVRRTVVVAFENFGTPTTVRWTMNREGQAWCVDNVVGRTIVHGQPSVVDLDAELDASLASHLRQGGPAATGGTP